MNGSADRLATAFRDVIMEAMEPVRGDVPALKEDVQALKEEVQAFEERLNNRLDRAVEDIIAKG